MKKRELVAEAFAELAIAGYTFDLTPDEMEGALRRMEGMMAEGIIATGYALSDPPDLDDEAGVTYRYRRYIVTNLAKEIASGYGKAVPASLQEAARSSRQSAINAIPPASSASTLGLIGAGGR